MLPPAAVLLLLPLRGALAYDPSVELSLDDAVRETVAHNSTVRAAKAQYEAAAHEIEQAYVPQDPLLQIQKSQTPNAFTKAQTQSVGVSESFQFPGVALLQGGQARRGAEVARLTYLSAQRDAGAQARTAYYQTLLDSASARINAENAASLAEVLEVARIAYTANQGAQTDLISAQFALSQASQAILASEVAEQNDEAALNDLMERHPEAPMRLTGSLELAAFELPLETVKARALAHKQEVLAAALSEKNAQAALKLAWAELLPGVSASWLRNLYPAGSINSTSPGGPFHDFSTSLSLSVPVFFWFRQKEDVRAAARLLEAARENRDTVVYQTETNVVQLYRSMQLAYKNALLDRDVLEPLARQNLRVALIAYQSKKIDFTTLASVLQSLFAARVNHLTAANQFLAARVALEQAMGGSPER